MRGPLAFAVAACLGWPAAPAAAPAVLRDSAGYRMAVAPRAFRFPADHASHPDFRSEWWYYTGHLEARGRRFGYELTFFRVGVSRAWRASASRWAPHDLHFAHFALTDEAGRKFRFDERISRPALGLAGADSARYHVWVDGWSAELAPDGRTHRLRAAASEMAIALDLEPLKPPAIHGVGGVSRKAAGAGRASHYYSLTRLATRGSLVVGRDTLAVAGESWMDHEFGSGALEPGQRGWDWVSLQLETGEDLMLYVLRRADGSVEPASSGTWVGRGGATRHLPLEAFELRATGEWTSPRTRGVYPSGWTVRVPSLGLDVALSPVLADQEVAATRTGGVVYWEGAVEARGARAGAPVRGRGYVELTGYAGRRPDAGP